MGITEAKLLFCHGIPDQSKYKKISLREYNDRKVYEWLNNQFIFYGGIKYLNLPHMPIGDSFRPNKRAYYTPDPLSSAISVASGNSISTLTTPSDPPQVIVLTFDTN